MKVAVICRAKGHAELRRKLGWWSYPVDGLTWQFFPQADVFRLEREAFAGFDLIVQEDWTWGEFVGKRPRVAYVIVDANTSERRRMLYREHAVRNADLILLDQCDPADWIDLGKPVHRWPYAVDETRFAPGEKVVDVACHLEKTADRQTLVGQLAALAQEWPGVVFALNRGMPVDEYAAALGRAKIVIHLGTHPQCRSHRVFDALAAGACLLTSPLPDYGDWFQSGQHYLEWRNFGQLANLIEDLLGGGWQEIAEQGRALVLERHTWRTRAREFVDIVEREHLC